MRNGRLKIRENRKIELKVNGKDQNNIKEFDFSSLSHGTYDCEVDLVGGNPVRIVVNGKEIPKNVDVVQQKVEKKKKRDNEIADQKEQEKQQREQKVNISKISQNQNNMNLADSFNRSKTRVPSDVRSLTTLTSIDNFALKLYKGARYESETQKFYFYNPRLIQKKIGAENRTLVDVFEIRHNNYGLDERIGKIAKQHKESARLLFDLEGCLEVKNFKPDWRVIVGLGTDSIYETGITLHHIYGFPYIPASSIKGITNHYAQDQGFDLVQSGSKQWYDDIFGNTKQKGKITFFDAMPLTPPQLKPDIMNVHFPDYYGSGSKPPTDTQSPRPILFLTVENTEFQFMIGCKEANKELLKIALSWLETALTEKGIGAKTAVGYGYMKEP
ncbi:MAG: type III-B CRISPR module RAMP protein Cmr6 [Sphingobacteriales bacterium]|nr:MAG: type III-B CRISPR module RAMP protein Cmr6 [Sphingobacteriales bacterium]